MGERLTPEQRWEERNFILVSLIRLHSMICLESEALEALVDVARSVRQIECEGGTVSDDVLLEKFMEEL